MTIKIEEGKFYKAETGEKVGPMERWISWEVEHPWQQKYGSSDFDENGDIWRDDGTSEHNVPRLVEEWKE